MNLETGVSVNSGDTTLAAVEIRLLDELYFANEERLEKNHREKNPDLEDKSLPKLWKPDKPRPSTWLPNGVTSNDKVGLDLAPQHTLRSSAGHPCHPKCTQSILPASTTSVHVRMLSFHRYTHMATTSHLWHRENQELRTVQELLRTDHRVVGNRPPGRHVWRSKRKSQRRIRGSFEYPSLCILL